MPKQELLPEPDENKEKVLGSENINDWEQDEQGVFQLKEEVRKAQLEEEKTPEKLEEEKGKLDDLYEGTELEKKDDKESRQSPEAEISPKQRLFRAACNERLDELVELGLLPKRFAEDRRKSAELIETGLSDDPEQQGVEFAEIGLEGVSAMRRAADEALEKATEQVQPYLDLVHDLIYRFEAAGEEKKVTKLQEVLSRIEETLSNFEETVKKVKDLEFPFKNLNAQITDLVADLEKLDTQGLQ